MSDRLCRLDHVGIVVQSLDASLDWYREHLGFERLTEYAIPGARVVFAGRADLRLEFFQSEGAMPMSPERETAQSNLKLGGINHFAIGVDDLEAVISELQAKGVEVASPPREVPDGRGDRFAFIRDNERMLIELFQTGRSEA